MKFKKFVKSLGADGILYVRENETVGCPPALSL